MNKIGVIQGRLSARPFPKLQEFPATTWEKEFEYAEQIGFDYIEWIFEENKYMDNPIWTSEGRKRINKIINDTKITVDSVCADYFLDKPIFLADEIFINKEIAILQDLIRYTSEIGAKVILLPVLENSEIKTLEQRKIFEDVLQQCILCLEKYDVRIGIESEMPCKEYYSLVAGFDSNRIGVYYDTGNCAYRGYDMRADMEILKDVLVCVHIKDRSVGGSSIWLGQGDANLKEGIPYLTSCGYKGNYTLQTYFEHDELKTAQVNYDFMKGLLKK